jgi:arylsulfatase A-like enzyme
MIHFATAWFRIGASFALAGLQLCSICGSANGASSEPRRPSIVFILADDLGYGDVGCFGQQRIKTPNIDKLAAEGMKFTSFYAGSTVCAPSRCALMTGKHSGHGTIRGNGANAALLANEPTVAELLKQVGYRTGLVGKWGLGELGSVAMPQKKGFDEFVGYLNQTHAHDYYTDHLFRHDPVTGFDGKMTIVENAGDQRGLYIPDLFTTAALNFVKNNRPEPLNRFRPFFLFLSYTIPHANNEEAARTGNGMQVPSDEPYSKETWPQIEKNKAAMITRMDGDIGKLMQKLKDSNLDDSTLVLFSSDNGAHKEGGVDPKFFNSSGPLTGTKRDLTEGGIRVPLIARWPGHIKPGEVNDTPWAFWDFLPTVTELAGTPTPKGIDGISFLPALLGQPQTNQHAFLYWEFHERGFQQAARTGEWKAIRPQADEPLELFNLKSDIGEKMNVAGKNPEVVAKFEEYLKTARSESPDWPIKKAPASPKKSGSGTAAKKGVADGDQ